MFGSQFSDKNKTWMKLPISAGVFFFFLLFYGLETALESLQFDN